MSQRAPEQILQQWQGACMQSGLASPASWPGPQASGLIAALLAASRGPTAAGSAASPGTGADSGTGAESARGSVDEAARAWVRRLPSLSTMNRQIITLRHVIVDGAHEGDGSSALADLLDDVLLVATEELSAQLEGAAMHDALTGAGNRRLLGLVATEAIESALVSGGSVCVVAIDLDGLKKTNDTHGHEAGDEAIVRLVAGLTAAARGSNQVFRTGGDEFAVLLTGQAAGAIELVERSADFQVPPFTWGAADTTEGHRTLEDLLRSADQRLYEKRRALRSGLAIAASVREGQYESLPPGAVLPRLARLKAASSRKRAFESAVSGALILAIGSVVVAISTGNHQICVGDEGPGVANCGLSNAVYYGGIVLVVVGACLLALGIGARVLLGKNPG